MPGPINPPPASGRGERELPAYVSNGCIGLRVRPVPLVAGMAWSAAMRENTRTAHRGGGSRPLSPGRRHRDRRVWLSDLPHQVRDLTQTYDFSCGELTSRFTFEAGGCALGCEVLTFASREDPDAGLPGADRSGRPRLRPAASRLGRRRRRGRPRLAPSARDARRARTVL
jgi:hypothetical protein